MDAKSSTPVTQYDSREMCAGVYSFLALLDEGFRANALARMDPARVVSLYDFHSFMEKWSGKLSSIGVISGTEAEPELAFLGPSPAVNLLRFPEEEAFDLNLDWAGRRWEDFHGRFDLVLCEQVLEHVASPEQAIKNVYTVLKQGGLAHFSFPSINNRHGEPYFFYGGFAVELVEHWARTAGFKVVHSAVWSSDKGSRMYSTCDWAPLALSGDIRFFWSEMWRLRGHPLAQFRALMARTKHWIRYPFQPLFSRRSSRNAVMSWVYLVK